MKIGVIGDGLVASVFKEMPNFEIVHRDGWHPVRWDGLVNCAALTSRIKCDEVPFNEVLKANVCLPCRMMEEIESIGKEIPFIQFSSCAVYRHAPHHEMELSESSPVFPLHAYGASKILMEQLLSDRDVHILRIPRVVTDNGHPSDFKFHIQNWSYVEDRLVSIVRGETLVTAVSNIMRGGVPTGIYNLATETIKLIDLVKQYGLQNFEVVPADSMKGLGPWPVLNVGKAKLYGVI